MVNDGNIGAFAGKMYRYGSANTAVSAGNQGYFIQKFVGSFIEVTNYFWLRVLCRLYTRLLALMLGWNLMLHNVATDFLGISQLQRWLSDKSSDFIGLGAVAKRDTLTKILLSKSLTKIDCQNPMICTPPYITRVAPMPVNPYNAQGAGSPVCH